MVEVNQQSSAAGSLFRSWDVSIGERKSCLQCFRRLHKDKEKGWVCTQNKSTVNKNWTARWGAWSKAGGVPEYDEIKVNQDALIGEWIERRKWVAVLDGHGINGDVASRTAANFLATQLLKEENTIFSGSQSDEEIKAGIKRIFGNIEDICRADTAFTHSGTTLTMLCLLPSEKDHSLRLLIANVGDSPCSVHFYDDDVDQVRDWHSPQHRPNQEEERLRKAGVSWHQNRLWSSSGTGISVSRSLGDNENKGEILGLSALPDITFLSLPRMCTTAIVQICSDGISDVLDLNENAAQVFLPYLHDTKKHDTSSNRNINHTKSELANKLHRLGTQAAEAWLAKTEDSRYYIDDRTLFSLILSSSKAPAACSSQPQEEKADASTAAPAQ